MNLRHGWRNTGSSSYRTACGFLVAAVVCGTAGLVINTAAGNPSKLSKHAVFEYGGSALVLWAVAAVLLLFAISLFNSARHATNHGRQRATARQLEAEHLTQARQLAGQLVAGEVPTVERVWDVVLQPGERILLDSMVGYSRYYGFGPQATYTHVSTRHYGNVGVGRALLDHAVDSAGNRSRAQGAAFAAAARWRDQQQARVLVSDRRLICQIQTKGWVSFDHASATAIKAVPEKLGVVLEYPDSAPMCLSGPATAQIMVIVVWALYGADGLHEHPALAEIRPRLPPATVRDMNEEPPFEPLETAAPAAAESAATHLAAEQPSTAEGPVHRWPRLDLLAFVAAHELVLAEHAALLLGVTEQQGAERLEGLLEQGLVSRVRLSVHSPTVYRITEHGAERVDRGLPPLRPLDLTAYRHTASIPGLWLAARSGRFGETRDMLTARQMQAADAALRSEPMLEAPDATFGNDPSRGEPDVDPANIGSG